MTPNCGSVRDHKLAEIPWLFDIGAQVTEAQTGHLLVIHLLLLVLLLTTAFVADDVLLVLFLHVLGVFPRVVLGGVGLEPLPELGRKGT